MGPPIPPALDYDIVGDFHLAQGGLSITTTAPCALPRSLLERPAQHPPLLPPWSIQETGDHGGASATGPLLPCSIGRSFRGLGNLAAQARADPSNSCTERQALRLAMLGVIAERAEDGTWIIRSVASEDFSEPGAKPVFPEPSPRRWRRRVRSQLNTLFWESASFWREIEPFHKFARLWRVATKPRRHGIRLDNIGPCRGGTIHGIVQWGVAYPLSYVPRSWSPPHREQGDRPARPAARVRQGTGARALRT
jgi:hypothetical protein